MTKLKGELDANQDFQAMNKVLDTCCVTLSKMTDVDQMKDTIKCMTKTSEDLSKCRALCEGLKKRQDRFLNGFKFHVTDSSKL